MKKIRDRRVLASFFRLGLVTGLLSRQDVIRCADKLLLESAVPAPEWIELSLSGALTYSRMIGLLHHMQGESAEYHTSTKMLFALADLRLEAAPDQAVNLAMGLRLLSAEEFLPAETRGELGVLEQQLSALQAGRLSSMSMAEWMEAWLAPYRQYGDWLEITHGEAGEAAEA